MTIRGRLILAVMLAALPLAASPVFAQAKPGDKLDKDKGAGSVKDQERAQLAEAYYQTGKRLYEDRRHQPRTQTRPQTRSYHIRQAGVPR